MRRFNYAPPLLERRIGAAAERALPPHLRAPLGAVAAALLAVALTATLEVRRARALDVTLAIVTEQSAQTTRAAERVTALDADVARLRRIEAALAQAHRDAVVRVNDLARLGNRLPERTWLTAIRTARDGSWSIEGRSARLVEIGATLAGIQMLDEAAAVRLLSIAAAGERARTLRFSIAWDRRP